MRDMGLSQDEIDGILGYPAYGDPERVAKMMAEQAALAEARRPAREYDRAWRSAHDHCYCCGRDFPAYKKLVDPYAQAPFTYESIDACRDCAAMFDRWQAEVDALQQRTRDSRTPSV